MLYLLLTVTLMACNASASENSSPNDAPGIIGYVMEKEDDRILVIDPEAQDFSETGGVSEYYNAIWFNNAPKDIGIGEKVKVWYDYTRDSYPAQSEVMYIEVIPSQKPEGVNLTEGEALYKALTSQLLNTDSIIVVKTIEYKKETDKWDIKLKEIWSDILHDVEVDDR